MESPNIVSFLEDKLTPDGQKEKFVFRKFDGYALAAAAEAGGSGAISSSDVEEVVLKINPSQWSVSKNKVTNKVATNAPGRFIIIDWGNDLDVHSISGVTGNLLPSVMTNGLDPAKSMVEDYVTQLDPGGANTDNYGQTMSVINTKIQKITSGALTYFQILNMSPKFKTFKKLERLYENFEADTDVLVIEAGESIYRAYFGEFSFNVTADSPWNWSYTLSFVVLDDLAKILKKDGDNMPKNSSIIDSDQ